MLKVMMSENTVTLELHRVRIDKPEEIDEMITKLEEAKRRLIDFRHQQLAESLQPLWENDL